MLNEQQIKGKWKEIKGGVQNLWGMITDEDLEKFKGNLYGLSGVIQEKYGETKEVIRSKLDKLMSSFDNATDKKRGVSGESSYERNPTATRPSATSEYQDIASDVKSRTPERKQFENRQGMSGGIDSTDYDAEEIYDESQDISALNKNRKRGIGENERAARH